MNQKYLYLIIDLAAIAIPLAASFITKKPFYKNWKFAWLAILIPAAAFLLWDALFTDLGVWGFNPAYITGIYIGNLPLEEVLFFICIPYACLFTYYALIQLVEKDYLFPHQEIISSLLSIVLMITGMYHLDKWYTGVTFLGLGAYLAFQMLVLKPRYMGRFYIAYALILLPFLIVNGLLTGSFIHEEVVWYNDSENLGWRIATIPFEDVFYGMFLIVLNISVYEWLKQRAGDYYSLIR